MPADSRTFIIPADWQIRDPDFYRERIWKPARAKNIARVPWLDALTLIYRYDGQIFWQSGWRFDVPEIDTVFPDPQNRWMSVFLASTPSGTAPLKHCRVLPKLRLIALYCDITNQDALQDA